VDFGGKIQDNLRRDGANASCLVSLVRNGVSSAVRLSGNSGDHGCGTLRDSGWDSRGTYPGPLPCMKGLVVTQTPSGGWKALKY